MKKTILSQYHTLPPCFQRQILCSALFSLAFFILALWGHVMALAFAIIIPAWILGLFFMLYAGNRYLLVTEGEYAVVDGICSEIQITAIRRLAKEVTLQTQEGIVILKMRRRLPPGVMVGTAVKLYLDCRTTVYHQSNVLYIMEYLAMEAVHDKKSTEDKEWD